MNKIYSEEKHLVLLGVVVKGISSHPLGLGIDPRHHPFSPARCNNPHAAPKPDLLPSFTLERLNVATRNQPGRRAEELCRN